MIHDAATLIRGQPKVATRFRVISRRSRRRKGMSNLRHGQLASTYLHTVFGHCAIEVSSHRQTDTPLPTFTAAAARPPRG
jgi:hypothetical protein